MSTTEKKPDWKAKLVQLKKHTDQVREYSNDLLKHDPKLGQPFTQFEKALNDRINEVAKDSAPKK